MWRNPWNDGDIAEVGSTYLSMTQAYILLLQKLIHVNVTETSQKSQRKQSL